MWLKRADRRKQGRKRAYRGILRRTGANKRKQPQTGANNTMLNEHIANTVKPKNVVLLFDQLFFCLCCTKVAIYVIKSFSNIISDDIY